MTSVRPPLSLNQALDRIAGQIPGGWVAMAAVTARGESTVRNWSNPNTPESVPMDCAIILDLEFQRCGGIGAPIHDVYALLLETGAHERFAGQAEIAAATMVSVKESADAHHALIACTLPGADDQDLDVAIREVEQDVEAAKRALTLLRAAKERKPP